MFRYTYLGAAIAVLARLNTTRMSAEPVQFPQGKSLRWWVACTEILAFKEGHELAPGKVPHVIEFGFSDNSYFSDGGHVYNGPVESDANWIRSASNRTGNRWELSRQTGELRVTNKTDGATTAYACRDEVWGEWTKF